MSTFRDHALGRQTKLSARSRHPSAGDRVEWIITILELPLVVKPGGVVQAWCVHVPSSIFAQPLLELGSLVTVDIAQFRGPLSIKLAKLLFGQRARRRTLLVVRTVALGHGPWVPDDAPNGFLKILPAGYRGHRNPGVDRH